MWLIPNWGYFKQGDIMPDYPDNNWGEVIWQFDGEKA